MGGVKKVTMFDHEWWLKTFDMNGNGVVKLWCGECKKHCRGGNKNHTKAHIDNLFNNFRRSHILNTTHVRNFRVAKNVNFDDHPQSEAKNGRPDIITPKDHKCLINEGVEMSEGVNAFLPDGHKNFTMLGNLTTEDYQYNNILDFRAPTTQKNSIAATHTLLESLDKLRPSSDHSPTHVYLRILQNACMLYYNEDSLQLIGSTKKL